jgi:small subunit ribosomal protein S18
MMVKKKAAKTAKRNRCRFCHPDDGYGSPYVDYKDVQSLKKLCTAQGKMFSRKRSGNCARHQRQVKRAVKLARYMALLPYVGE